MDPIDLIEDGMDDEFGPCPPSIQRATADTIGSPNSRDERMKNERRHMETIIGAKLLTEDGQSIFSRYGRVMYPIDQWVDVPGNGAYVAVTGGLTVGGTGPLFAWIECDPRSEFAAAELPDGVRCFRRVRRIAAPPKNYAGPIRTVSSSTHTCADGQIVCARDNARVVQSGGQCWARDTASVAQSGGQCWVNDTASVAQSGGQCWARDTARVTKSGGWCWARDTASVTKSGGQCWVNGNARILRQRQAA